MLQGKFKYVYIRTFQTCVIRIPLFFQGIDIIRFMIYLYKQYYTKITIYGRFMSILVFISHPNSSILYPSFILGSSISVTIFMSHLAILYGDFGILLYRMSILCKIYNNHIFDQIQLVGLCLHVPIKLLPPIRTPNRTFMSNLKKNTKIVESNFECLLV